MEKKLFLLDMDGTLYLGNHLFEGCLDFLSEIRSRGGRYLFLTNNSSKSVDKYIEKWKVLGITTEYEDFLTSSQATARYLKIGNYHKIYVLGTEALKQEFKEQGLSVTDTLEDGIDCLTMGFDTELTFQKLENACRLLTNESIDYVATNPDWVCPTEFGSVPDCGSISQILHNATGRTPVFIGKPQPEMVYMAIEMTEFAKEETVIIGDRLYTDIACGINAGIDSYLVLSGESKMEDLHQYEFRPTKIFQDIREICKAMKKGMI